VSDIEAAPESARDVIGRAVTADRGYDGDGFRKLLKGNNNEPVIPGRKNRKEPIKHDREMYKKRGYIERDIKKTGGGRRGMKNRI
jgi:hypothetical protein